MAVQSSPMETLAPVAVRRYRLTPESLPAAEQMVRNRQLVPYLVIVAALILISTFLGFRGGNNVFVSAIITGLFLTYIFFIVPRRTRRVLSRCWSSYALEIGPDYLLRQQADTPDLRLAFSEIKRIERRPDEYVRVIGTKRMQIIGIPHGIERFDEVWQTIGQLAPVTEHASDQYLLRNLITAAFGVGFLGMLWSTSPRIVFPLAAALGGVLIWRMIVVRRSPNVSRQTKRAVWVYAWVIFLVVLKVFSVISQFMKH